MAASSVELITFDQSRKQFFVKPEAVAILQKLQGPVAVLAVCGRARMGKSTLLNQLATKLTGVHSKGFTVASTHKPCTKGLHLWSKPIQRTMADGKKINVLLVDCEGIDAFDQTMDYSTQIFSLGVLLSSLLIFNQMGGIDESAIDKLSSVCEFAKLIQAKSTQGGGAVSAQELSPYFLWLLRDFQFQLNEDGRQISTKEYMEETLRDMPGTTTAIKNRNQMRASIKAVFPERDCFSLVRPCLEESDLANMDKLRPEQLRPEFKQGLERLVSLVMSCAHPKQYRGQYVSGSALAAFAQAYVDVINKGQVPAISSTWQSVMRGENQRALESALAAYERAFATGWQQQQQTPNAGGTPGGTSGSGSSRPDLQEQLDCVHAAAVETALKEFDEQALGDASERRTYEGKLREQAGLRFAVVRQTRLAEADRKITDLLSSGGTKLLQLFGADPVDLAKVDAELAAVLQQYDVQASGPSKYKRVAEFLVNTVVRSLGDVAKRALAASATATAKLQAARKEAAEAQGRATDLGHRTKTLESAEASLKLQLQSAQQQVTALQGDASEKGRALAAAQARLDALQADHREASTRAERNEQRASAAELRAAEAQAQAAAQRSDAARDASSAEQRLRELSAARQEQEQRRSAAEAERAQAQERVVRLEGDLARLQAEVQLVGARRDAAEVELGSSRAEATRQLQARDASIAQLQAEVRELRQAAAGRNEDRERAVQLTKQLSDQEVVIQRLQQERAFLQQQYDTLRRESLSPRAVPYQQLQQPQQAPTPGLQAGTTLQPPPADAAAVRTDDMELGTEPNRKRRRVAEAQAQAVEAATTVAGAGAAVTPVGAADGAAGGRRAGNVSPAPFSSERRVELGRRGTPGAADGAGLVGPSTTPAAVAQPQVPENLARMTIQEMKNWLTGIGAEDSVFEYNGRKPAPKKQDWMDLIKQRCGQ